MKCLTEVYGESAVVTSDGKAERRRWNNNQCGTIPRIVFFLDYAHLNDMKQMRFTFTLSVVVGHQLMVVLLQFLKLLPQLFVVRIHFRFLFFQPENRSITFTFFRWQMGATDSVADPGFS